MAIWNETQGEKMEKEYWAECPACDTETQVMVVNEEYEQPNHCPMCGLPCEFEELEEDNDDGDTIDI